MDQRYSVANMAPRQQLLQLRRSSVAGDVTSEHANKAGCHWTPFQP